MRRLKAKNLAKLVRFISVRFIEPHERGNPVILITLWNGMIVCATYCIPQPDETVLKTSNFFISESEVEPHVIRLIEKGESFATDMGSDNQVIRLRWKIESKD